MEKVTKSSRVRDKFMPLASGMNLSRTLELLVTFSVKWKLYYKLIGMAFMHGRSSMISFPSLKRIKITLSRGARFARSLLRGKFFYPLSRWKTYHALPPMHDRDIHNSFIADKNLNHNVILIETCEDSWPNDCKEMKELCFHETIYRKCKMTCGNCGIGGNAEMVIFY